MILKATQHGKMRTKKNIDVKLAIEKYLKKNMKNLMVYAGGAEERQHKRDFLHHQDFLNPFKINFWGEKEKIKFAFGKLQNLLKVFIRTFGRQMNDADSEVMGRLLQRKFTRR